MQENYEHYISKHLKMLYKKRLVAPILYLVVLTVILVFLPVTAVVFPKEIKSSDSMESLYTFNSVYVKTTIKNLHFTGYTKSRFGRTVGYYYYYRNNNDSFSIVLLSPSTCEEGLPSINSIRVYAKVVPQNDAYKDLLVRLSDDLSWTESGLRSMVSTYYLSEPDFHYITGMLLFWFAVASGVLALISILLSILYIFLPYLSPPCRVLNQFGRPKELLAQAEDELLTLPQLTTEDMFITEHFFIETSKYGIALIPIQEILWIYKHSTLHKIFWYHFSISYTLHITANKRIYFTCPQNIKSDIDGIIDYLAEANHDILIGFSEENRLKIKSVQGDPFHFERFIQFLQRRI